MLTKRLTKVEKSAPATMEEAFTQFISWKKVNNLSEQTIPDYTSHNTLIYFLNASPILQNHMNS